MKHVGYGHSVVIPPPFFVGAPSPTPAQMNILLATFTPSYMLADAEQHAGRRDAFKLIRHVLVHV